MEKMQEFAIDRSRQDDSTEIKNSYEAPEGQTEELVRTISKDKNEQRQFDKTDLLEQLISY